MKRIGLVVLFGLLLFGGWYALPVEAQTNYLKVVGLTVSSGGRINIEGSAGDTYLIRDTDTGCMQEWKDGALGWQLCSGYAVPPECPSDLATVAFGGLCRNLSTGKILYRGVLEAIP